MKYLCPFCKEEKPANEILFYGYTDICEECFSSYEPWYDKEAVRLEEESINAKAA